MMADEVWDQPAGEAEESPAQRAGIWKMLRLLWEVLADDILGQRLVLIKALLCSLLSAGSGMLAPLLIKGLIDDYITPRHLAGFATRAALICLSLVGYFVFYSVEVYYSTRGAEQVFFTFKCRLLGGILNKREEFYARYDAGDVVTRLNSDVDMASEFFNGYVVPSLADVPYAVILALLIFLWDWRLGIAAAVFVPLNVLILRASRAPLSRLAGRAREMISRQNEVLLDILAGQRTLRFYQQRRGAVERFALHARRYADANAKSLRAMEWSGSAYFLVCNFAENAPYLVGGYLICAGFQDISVGKLVAFSTYLLFFSSTFQVPMSGLMHLARVAPALRRLREVQLAPEVPPGELRGITDAPASYDIAFTHVGFGYRPDDLLIRDFSLTIRAGERVAIMGGSGSGKSTLLNLLLRFLEPTRGAITFGGRNIHDYPLPFYLSFFAYVTQDTHTFKLPVSDNITMGWYHVPLDKIQNAARLVRMDDVIRALPEGYSTVLGLRGQDLSGGQKQRLALARALVRESFVLVLDEFTSNLDSQTQDGILDDLFAVFKNETIICVTHFESVAKRFDRIVRLGGPAEPAPAAGAAPGRDVSPEVSA